MGEWWWWWAAKEPDRRPEDEEKRKMMLSGQTSLFMSCQRIASSHAATVY